MNFLSYNDIRNVAKDGDIVFVCGSWKDFIEATIMFFTSSAFSHCFIVFWADFDTPEKRLMLVEAQGGTTRRLLNVGFYEGRKFAILPAPKPWVEVSETALARLGKVPYSMITAIYVGLCNFVWKRLHLRLPKFNTKGEICSEFVARTYHLDQQEVSPQELWDLLIKKD